MPEEKGEICIGIDLGTTNSAMAIKEKGLKILQNREGETVTPSVVSIYKGELLVGRTAATRGELVPEDTIRSIKRLMGRSYEDKEVKLAKGHLSYKIVQPKSGAKSDLSVVMGGKEYSPIEISAEILKKIKRDAEDY